MPNFDFDIGILGGGAAGLTVASGAAQLGAKTILIEKDGKLGGDCLHYGCVPSKTLIRTARVRHLLQHAPAFGLPPVQTGPVDFRDVAARIRSVIATIQKHDSPERFCGLGAQVLFGSGTFTDEHTFSLEGKEITAKSWVIATGSSPAVPKISGIDGMPYLTNRDIFSLDRLPVTMIFLGGGPISIEMSQAFTRLGSKVTVVEMAPQILGREDRDMAEAVMKGLSGEGVIFHLGAKVLSARDLGSEREIVIEKEGQALNLRAEAVVVAAGREANVHGLGLDAIGVEFSGRGIAVDDRLRTTQKHIYAAGDVTGTYQFTHAAGYEGGVVVANAVFRLPRRTDYTFFPWCTYVDPELASIGLNEKAAQERGIEYTAWTEEFSANDRALAEGASAGKLKMILDERERPLGVQILGPHAGDLIGEWAAVLNGKVGLSTLAGAVHPYPTLGEINKRVAGSFLSTKIFSDRVKKGLKFFFHLKGRACGTS